jgi:hypothetical protein
MAAWFLNPALTRFRGEVNSRWPRRDKTSDGTIGDTAHQATDSDHNPDRDGSVDAWDMDVDGVDVQAVIAAALRHESIAYVIYNRRITSRNQSGGLGVWHPYTGSSPHTEHVHFNTRESHENSAKPWFPPTEEDMTLEQFIALMDAYAARLNGTTDAQKRIGRDWAAAMGVDDVAAQVAALDVKVSAFSVTPLPEIDYEKLARALLAVAAE